MEIVAHLHAHSDSSQPHGQSHGGNPTHPSTEAPLPKCQVHALKNGHVFLT